VRSEGALAIHLGRWIIRQARSPILEDFMIALIVISTAGSVFSIYQWGEKSKRTSQQAACQRGLRI
jgi:hypothetical protein